MSTDKSEKSFITLLSNNQRKIYSYILASVGRRSIADEIMQQTLLTMWKNYSRFKQGTNFSAWGKEVSKYEIYSYRKKKAKAFLLDQEALEKVMDASQKHEDSSDLRVSALEGCLKKLSSKYQNMIHFRYNEGHSCLEVSKEMNCPISTVYTIFARLHTSLRDCIHRTLAIWEAQS